jgi:hypothetical protein
LIEKLKQLSDIFYDSGIEDVYTNSKIYRDKLSLLIEQREEVRRLEATMNVGDVRRMIDRGDAVCLP